MFAHHINHTYRNPITYLFFCMALINHNIHKQMFIPALIWDVNIIPLKGNYHEMVTTKPIVSSCGDQPVVTPSGLVLWLVKTWAMLGDTGKFPWSRILRVHPVGLGPYGTALYQISTLYNMSHCHIIVAHRLGFFCIAATISWTAYQLQTYFFPLYKQSQLLSLKTVMIQSPGKYIVYEGSAITNTNVLRSISTKSNFVVKVRFYHTSEPQQIRAFRLIYISIILSHV